MNYRLRWKQVVEAQEWALLEEVLRLGMILFLVLLLYVFLCTIGH